MTAQVNEGVSFEDDTDLCWLNMANSQSYMDDTQAETEPLHGLSLLMCHKEINCSPHFV